MTEDVKTKLQIPKMLEKHFKCHRIMAKMLETMTFKCQNCHATVKKTLIAWNSSKVTENV